MQCCKIGDRFNRLELLSHTGSWSWTTKADRLSVNFGKICNMVILTYSSSCFALLGGCKKNDQCIATIMQFQCSIHCQSSHLALGARKNRNNNVFCWPLVTLSKSVLNYLSKYHEISPDLKKLVVVCMCVSSLKNHAQGGMFMTFPVPVYQQYYLILHLVPTRHTTCLVQKFIGFFMCGLQTRRGFCCLVHYHRETWIIYQSWYAHNILQGLQLTCHLQCSYSQVLLFVFFIQQLPQQKGGNTIFIAYCIATNRAWACKCYWIAIFFNSYFRCSQIVNQRCCD